MRNQTSYSLNGGFTDVMSSLPYPDQLGSVLYDKNTDAYYQLVHMSSTAADAATPTPAAGLVAYWKDSDSFEVCTHVEASEGSRNSVAGVLKAAVLAGKYGWVQKSGKCSVVGDGSTTISVGRKIIADGQDAGSCAAIAVGTASTYIPFGTIISVSGSYSSTTPLAKLCLIKE